MDLTTLDSLALGNAYVEKEITQEEYLAELRRRRSLKKPRMDYYLTNAQNPLYKTDGEKVWYFHGLDCQWQSSFMDPQRLLKDLEEYSVPRPLTPKEIGKAVVETVMQYNKGPVAEKIRGLLST